MPRVEIFTGTERRRRWPDADKLRVLDEASVPGISAASVARRHDILPQQIYRWRRQFGFPRAADRQMAGKGVNFLPLELIAANRTAEGKPVAPSPAPASNQSEHFAEVELRNGRRLRVAPSIEETSLRRLIRTAETA